MSALAALSVPVTEKVIPVPGVVVSIGAPSATSPAQLATPDPGSQHE